MAPMKENYTPLTCAGCGQLIYKPEEGYFPDGDRNTPLHYKPPLKNHVRTIASFRQGDSFKGITNLDCAALYTLSTGRALTISEETPILDFFNDG